MPFDTQKLDAEIRRLQMIRELANDPESRALLERFITHNGHGTKTVRAEKPIHAADSHNGARPRKYGEMKKYALEVLSSTPQTVKQIVDRMIARGFKPVAADPGPSVTEVLRNLEKKGQIKRSSDTGAYGAFLWTK
jgi:hypothetical protein